MNPAHTKARVVALFAAAVGALVASTARAQSATGRITGKVTDAATNAALGDVVLTATSPALQGEQTVVSDATGEFEIPTLPPGTYLLHLEKDGYKPLNQPDIIIRLDKVIRVNLSMVPESMKAEEVVVVGKAPTVDVGSTQTGSTITDDFINNVPVASPNSFGGAVRSFESLQNTAPGAAEDEIGISIAGTTSPENNYVIDGVSVTDPAFGTLGSSMSIDFIKEVDVITGGYMPEYGRATGGVTNVVTKSGGNEFHGELSLYVTPGFLTAPAKQIVLPGQALSSIGKTDLIANMGITIGGPIIKDKLWFFVGFEPTAVMGHVDRYVAVTKYKSGCPVDAQGNEVSSASAADHFDASKTDCSPAIRGTATDASGAPVVASTTPIQDSKRTYDNVALGYQVFGKLTYLLNQDQRFSLSVFGNPQTGQGGGGGAAPYASTAAKSVGNSQDYNLRWDGSFFDKHMLTEAVLGWHHTDADTEPLDPAQASQPGYEWVYGPSITYAHSLVEFEPDAAKYCGANDPSAPNLYYACPINGYSTGGLVGPYKVHEDSYQARIAATNLFKAAGHHEVKYGIDFVHEKYITDTSYSGGVLFEEIGQTGNAATPSYMVDLRRFGYLKGPDDPVFLDGYHNETSTNSIAGFVQDSYRVLDLFTVNAGVRWEDQQLTGGTGDTVISLPNNWMPRIGVIYDPTQRGRSKIFANYAVYYEQVPIDLLDREFPPQTTIYAYHECNANAPLTSSNNCTNPGTTFPSVTSGPNQTWTAIGGSSTPVDPNLKGQSTTELSAGGEYEIIPDGRLGVTYTHRFMNHVIEDLSTDNAQTYVLANPGEGLATSFPKFTRDYDAASLYFNKSFAHRWLLDANYTVSYLRGNYQGLYIHGQPTQLDPNITAAGDLAQWFVNASGPLPGDHTHNIKLYAAYDIPIDATQDVTVGVSYTALSGSPTDYTGFDQIAANVYGQNTVFILPRGSGPRLPWIHDVDTSVKYNHKFGDLTFTASGEIFNLFDFREVTSVDEIYSFSTVTGPVVNGTTSDLNKLKTVDGKPVVVNPTFQQPTSYQSPLSVRLGLKLTF